MTAEDDVVRTQIQFTDDEIRGLKAEATARGVSVSALVREAVDARLAAHPEPPRDQRVRRALAACGRFHSGLGDISARHDAYLAESIGE